MENQRLRAAIYVRVSTARQAQEGYSLDAQERAARSYCLAHGYQVCKVYADEGVSAKDIAHRQKMVTMLEDADNGMIDVVVVWSLSRFTRSVSDLYLTCERLRILGVALESCTEAFETRTAMGRAMLGMLGVFAQLEREATAERVVAAMEERARKGLPTCAYVLGYDRDGNRLVINHAEAEDVRYIYRAYLDCQSISTVTRLCRSKGITGKKGGVMDTESVHKILTNPMYCGFVKWHGEIFPGCHDPIISAGTYNRVQLVIQGCARGRKRLKSLIFVPMD